MSNLTKSEGYNCEFEDSVSDFFYCKKCSLIARKMTATSCCGESFCHACIADIHQQGKPCPDCGKESFNIYDQLKYQKLIGALRAYCSMKERGCEWLGTVNELDTHLDPDLDNCLYVDTKCPLNCRMAVPKNQVEQHVREECHKRPHVCQHCNFRATYEEVVNIHIPECKYVPLQCPNRCGVSCEREDMEDHMKICRLEELQCKFHGVGCKERVSREDEPGHVQNSYLEHLTLTATETIQIKVQFQQKIGDLEKKLQDQSKALEKRFQDLEQKFENQEQQLKELISKQEEEGKLLKEQVTSLLQAQSKKDVLLSTLMRQVIDSSRTFEVRNFSRVKTLLDGWDSPAMYSHVGGYKFCFHVWNDVELKATSVDVRAMEGEFDEDLKWPVEAVFTLVLLNQQGGEDEECMVSILKWRKPKSKCYSLASFNNCSVPWGKLKVSFFVEDSKLNSFLLNDTLHFHLKHVSVESM